ncbi:MAG: phospholipase D family protein [Synergistaceae bacterium]|nr:phospholipase D family protein [Synergistaceae bacterium]
MGDNSKTERVATNQPHPKGTAMLNSVGLGTEYKNVTANVFIGYSAGDKILDEIRQANESVRICTPNLGFSAKITELLDNKIRNTGVKVGIVTVCSEKEKNSKEHRAALRKLLEYKGDSAVCDKLDLLVYKSRVYQEEKNSGSEYLQAHAKIYLIDNAVLYIPSANFTASGMEFNLETCTRIEKGSDANNKLIERMSALFDSLVSIENDLPAFTLEELESLLDKVDESNGE